MGKVKMFLRSTMSQMGEVKINYLRHCFHQLSMVSFKARKRSKMWTLTKEPTDFTRLGEKKRLPLLMLIRIE